MAGDGFQAEPALWRSVGRGALCGLAIGAVLELINVSGDTRSSAVLLVGMPVACLVLLQLVRASVAEVPPPDSVAPQSVPTPEYFIRLRQLERQLDRACRDTSNYEWTVRPMLAQLAAERLHAKHGVSVRRDPEHAREVVGEQLWQIMTIAPDQPSRPVSRNQLRELVQAISRI